MASFYDLDYIISMNEKRLEQYAGAYHKTIDRFTNIMVIYSAFAIFLVPITQSLFFAEGKCHFVYYCSFSCFTGLFSYSLINTIRLLIPIKVAYLKEPRLYYKEYRRRYEKIVSGPKNRRQREIDYLIKSSYINELEYTINVNDVLFKRKGQFYRTAFIWALYAVVPYLVCLGFQLAGKNEKQKATVITKFRNFNKSEVYGN